MAESLDSQVNPKSDSPILTLAPGSGAGVGKLLSESLLSDPDFVPELKAALRASLHATTPRRWDKDTGKWVVDPDYRVRVQTVALILAHMEGEPVKRVIHQHIGPVGLDVAGALEDSPALTSAVERALHNAKQRARRAKKAEPAEQAGELET